jgi:5-methylcytosine-specific restriction endonuclease McrA
MSKADKGHRNLLGYRHTEEAKIKISESHRGEKCHLWQGGISFEPYTTDWTKTLKKSIRERDKYTCRICGKEPAICVHHIDYDKKNCNSINLITLCRSCHSKTNKNMGYWINYFNNITNL